MVVGSLKMMACSQEGTCCSLEVILVSHPPRLVLLVLFGFSPSSSRLATRLAATDQHCSERAPLPVPCHATRSNHVTRPVKTPLASGRGLIAL